MKVWRDGQEQTVYEIDAPTTELAAQKWAEKYQTLAHELVWGSL